MGRGSLLFLAAVMSSALVGGAIAETQDFSLYEGKNLALSCSFTGNANISWTFLRNDGVDNVTVVEKFVECNATCNYTLNNITSANSGVYNCSVDSTVVSTYNVIVMTMTNPSANDFVSSAPSTSPVANTTSSTLSESTDAGTNTDNATSITSSESTDAGTATDNATSTSSESTDAGTATATDNTTSTPSESTDSGIATDNTTSTPSESTYTGTATDNATDGTTTDQPAGVSPLNVAAVAGGAAGGVVFLFLIIIIIIFLCRSKRKSDVDGVVHRPHKKTAKEGSKKHRSTILSLRHKLPLFSTPYDEDDDDEIASNNSDYRPNSKVASQIRVNLEASDGDEGTVENGFVPAKLVTANDEDESPYSMGIVEGRLGIMGPGTFAAANADSEKLDLVNENQNRSDDDDEDAEAETAMMNDTYTKVYKSNNPGDASFDNMLYGPIAGVDDQAKASMYDEEQTTENSQALDGKHLTSNETDNACHVDTPNGDVNVGEEGHENGVAKCDSEYTDITLENQNTDRESAAYAEIP